MNINGFDITKIYATPDSNFLWGLNDLGEPVYSFQENDAILTDYKNNLTIGEDAELTSYSDIGDGYCNNNKIRVNSLIDVLNSEESLEACEELCNSYSDCKYMSYSDNLNICNIYSSGGTEVSIYKEAGPPYESGYFKCEGTVGNGRFQGQSCNEAFLTVKSEEDDIDGGIEASIEIDPNHKGAHNWCDNITGCSLKQTDACENDRNPNSNFITYKKNEVDVRTLESGLN